MRVEIDAILGLGHHSDGMTLFLSFKFARHSWFRRPWLYNVSIDTVFRFDDHVNKTNLGPAIWI